MRVMAKNALVLRRHHMLHEQTSFEEDRNLFAPEVDQEASPRARLEMKFLLRFQQVKARDSFVTLHRSQHAAPCFASLPASVH